MKQKLSEMLSESGIEKLKDAVRKAVGDKAFDFIYPAIVKALEKGDKEVRTQILIDWLDVDFCRVCSVCGKVFQEGWYNMGEYACSDKCVRKQDGISKKEFEKFQIYKGTIENYLEDTEDDRNINKLTKEEIDEILDNVLDECDAYYTSWE